MTTLDPQPQPEDSRELPDVSGLNLSMESQFALTSFEQQADKMDRDTAIFFLKSYNRQRLLRESVYKDLFLKPQSY